jgi:hypothetical protein
MTTGVPADNQLNELTNVPVPVPEGDPALGLILESRRQEPPRTIR